MLEKTVTQRSQETFPRPHSPLVLGFHYKPGPLCSKVFEAFPLITIITIEEANVLGLKEAPGFFNHLTFLYSSNSMSSLPQNHRECAEKHQHWWWRKTRSPVLRCQQWKGSAEKLDGLEERSSSSGGMPVSGKVKTGSSLHMSVVSGLCSSPACPIIFGQPGLNPSALWGYLLVPVGSEEKICTNSCGCFPISDHHSVPVWLALSKGTPASS